MPRSSCCHSCIFFNPTAPTEIYPLSLHDALPISPISAIASTENTSSWAMRTRRVRRVRWIRRRTSSAERPYGWALGDSSISVQRAVADAEGVQPGQVGAQPLLELLPALLGRAPGALGQGAHAWEGHVLHVGGGGHLLRPQLPLQADHQGLLVLSELLGAEVGGVDVLDRGQPADRQRLVLGISLVVIEVGVFVV